MTRLVWFRNDLRVTDHPALEAYGSAGGAGSAGYAEPGSAGAAEAGSGGDAPHHSQRLLPVYIFSPRYFARTRFGFPKTGPHRAQFLLETVQDLRRALQQRGSDLVVAQGPPAQVLTMLARQFDVDELWYQEEGGTEEAAEVAQLREELALRGRSAEGYRELPVRLCPHHGQTMYHPDDLPFTIDQMPLVYSDFRKTVEHGAPLRSASTAPTLLPPLPAPAAAISQMLSEDSYAFEVRAGVPDVQALSGSPSSAVDPRGAVMFTGGESAAWKRLNAYFWDGDHLRRYKQTRNGLLGADYSSKFSPWLANGSLSPRSVVAEVRRYETERIKNSSTYWLVFELIWRDYFAFLLRKFGSAMFRYTGPMNRHYRWADDWTRFTAWREGTTGQDFIDANMRELAATGYMSNRGRQNVASYLSRDLKVNWQIGAEYFESHLVDYDPASNYGNWTYTVGVGTDPRRDRLFNPEVQSAKYDPQARYRLHWLTEPNGST